MRGESLLPFTSVGLPVLWEGVLASRMDSAFRDQPKKCLSRSSMNSCTDQCRRVGNKAGDGCLENTVPCQMPQRRDQSWTGQQWAQLCPGMPAACSWCPLWAQPRRLPREGNTHKEHQTQDGKCNMKSPTWSHITTVLEHRIYPLLCSSTLNLDIMWHRTIRLLPASTPGWLLHNPRNRSVSTSLQSRPPAKWAAIVTA